MAQACEVRFTLSDIAARLGGDMLGDGQTPIRRIATLASAGIGDIAFLANRKYKSQLHSTQAAAIILAPDAVNAFSGPRIVTENPYAYYARVAALLNPASAGFSGVHPSAVVASPLPADSAIGPQVSIGQRVSLGEGVVIHAGCSIGDDVSIGAGSILYPQVTIYHGCRVGKRAILHSGVVIGADGFGFAPDGNNWIKIPQIGGVSIGDDVEIGANTTVNRGALDDTVIGDGCKIDNLVQIAHNCIIGANSVLAGCAGLAGSVTLGEHCIVGGGGDDLRPCDAGAGYRAFRRLAGNEELLTSRGAIPAYSRSIPTINGCTMRHISGAFHAWPTVFQSLRKNLNN